MTRLVPKTLRGWLILIVLSTLVVSQTVLVLTLLGERRAVAFEVFEAETFSRIQWALDRVEQQPPEEWADLEASLTSTGFTVEIDAEPLVAADEIDPRLSVSLGTLIADDPSSDARVRHLMMPNWPAFAGAAETVALDADASDPPEAFVLSDDAVPDPPGRWTAARLQDGFGPTLVASVRLSGDQWLNVQARQKVSFDPVSTIMIAGGATAALLTLLAVWGAARVARPLEALGAAANRVDVDADYPLPPEKGPADLKKAIAAFNAMVGRVRRMLQDQQTLLQSVGHDLRTPLASLRIWLEFVKDKELRERMVESVEEIERLTADAIEAARGESAETPEPFDLTEMVGSICSEQASLGRPVQFVDRPVLRIVGRRWELRRAVRNLIDNAVKHGLSAEISIEADGQDAIVTVRDHGPGVPEAELARITDPFVQLDKARSGRNRGYGLGLAIVSSIARRNGGALTLANNPDGGLTARLRIGAFGGIA